ncbi:MAG: hypothetical protein ACI4M6_04680 [Christensenellaceae bacterium]
MIALLPKPIESFWQKESAYRVFTDTPYESAEYGQRIDDFLSLSEKVSDLSFNMQLLNPGSSLLVLGFSNVEIQPVKKNEDIRCVGKSSDARMTVF